MRLVKLLYKVAAQIPKFLWREARVLEVVTPACTATIGDGTTVPARKCVQLDSFLPCGWSSLDHFGLSATSRTYRCRLLSNLVQTGRMPLTCFITCFPALGSGSDHCVIAMFTVAGVAPFHPCFLAAVLVLALYLHVLPGPRHRLSSFLGGLC